MRDDLHRTVPVPRHWKRVLRHATREADRVTRLPRAMEDAVRTDLARHIRRSWIESVRNALSEGNGDFFRETRIGEVVRQCGALAVTPSEREVAECMRARAAFRQNSPHLLADAMRDVAKRVEERSCEQLPALVGKKDSAQLRKVLNTARRLCQPQNLIDSSGNVVPGNRSPREDIDLNEPIAP